MTWILKGCPRCGGDLSEEQTTGGNYWECLQCSYRLDFPLAAIHQEAPQTPTVSSQTS